jgi:hypothetical protein
MMVMQTSAAVLTAEAYVMMVWWLSPTAYSTLSNTIADTKDFLRRSMVDTLDRTGCAYTLTSRRSRYRHSTDCS